MYTNILPMTDQTAHNLTMEGFCELPREQAATSRTSLKGAVVAIGGTWKSAAHTDARESMYEFCVQRLFHVADFDVVG